MNIVKMETTNSDSTETVKRRKRSASKDWNRVKHFKKREKGEEYLGYQYETVVTNGNAKIQFVPKNTRPSRKLGPRCQGHNEEGKETGFCCDRITDEEREAIFQNFWRNLSWPERKIFIPNLVKVSRVQRRRTDSWDEKRSLSYKYFLKPNSDEVRVCLTMFASTFDLPTRTIQRWISMNPLTLQDPTHLFAPSNLKESNLETLIQFFMDLPKLPNHFVRLDSSKVYLEPTIQSKAQLFTMYTKTCAERNEKTVSRKIFDDEFQAQNLSLHSPKKVQCNDCLQFNSGHFDMESYEQHILAKDRATAEKSKDQNLAENARIHLLTVDVQAVQQTPVLNTAESFFKSKLNVHNYTVYDVGTNDVTCYWWTEVECDLSEPAFISCLIYHCETNFRDSKPIVIYSDGCSFRNRNIIMSNALLNFAMQYNKVVVQKFLIKGHSEMEVDSVHSGIDAKKKGQEIHLPGEYLRISKSARTTPRPYNAMLLTREFFKDFLCLSEQLYKTIRPGKGIGAPQIEDLRALKYNPDGSIYFQTDFDDPWQKLPGKVAKPKPLDLVTIKILHEKPRPLSYRKFMDLQSLKPYIPHDCHSYYDSLPHAPAISDNEGTATQLVQ